MFDTRRAILYKQDNFSVSAGDQFRVFNARGAKGSFMSIQRELVMAVAEVVDLAFSVYIFIVLARAIISWVNPDPYNPIVRFLHNATDPVLDRLRRWVPLQFGGIDFSPMVLLVALTFAQRMVKILMFQLANGF